MPSRSEQLSAHVRGEILQFAAGEIIGLSSIEELRDQFGYAHERSVYKALRKSGLTEVRRQVVKGYPSVDLNLVQSDNSPSRIDIQRDGEIQESLFPSYGLAWMLGVLTSGGHVNPEEKGKISIDSVDTNFLNVYSELGERLFKTNARKRYRTNQQGRRELKGIVFYGKELAQQLGDLRRIEWLNTVLEQHHWIFESRSYIWGFLEGYFERKGNVYFKTGRRSGEAEFYTNQQEVANFIMDLLVRVGIQNPRLDTKGENSELVDGVIIGTQRDLKLFAQNIHSVDVNKEERLKYYRQLEIHEPQPPKERSQRLKPEYETLAPQQIIDDYDRARMHCLLETGSLPTLQDLNSMYAQGIISIRGVDITRLFHVKGYYAARAELEKLIAKRSLEKSSNEATQLYPEVQ